MNKWYVFLVVLATDTDAENRGAAVRPASLHVISVIVIISCINNVITLRMVWRSGDVIESLALIGCGWCMQVSAGSQFHVNELVTLRDDHRLVWLFQTKY